ncbi:MAG: hypothetical protein Q4G28_10710 [Neisseria sp.]|nr:hypothetical protein [Neisseria sp.]
MENQKLLDKLHVDGYISIRDTTSLHSRTASSNLLAELKEEDKYGMELHKRGMYEPTEVVDIYWIQNNSHPDIQNDSLNIKKVMKCIYDEELVKLQNEQA